MRVLDNRFDPAQLVIAAGDTVTWANAGRMAHNVRADDGQFRCAEACDDTGPGGTPEYDPSNPTTYPGDPSNGSWSSTVRFDRTGSVRYHCEVHGASGGVGMSGTITVGSTGVGDTTSGAVEFTDDRVTVREDRGPATIRVRRVGGTAGAISVRVNATPGSASETVDFTPISQVLQWPDGAGGDRSVTVPVLDDAIVEGVETVLLTLTEVTGGATLGARAISELRITDDDSNGGGGAGDGGVLDLVVDRSAALEGGSPAELVVERSGSTTGRVTVDWSIGGSETSAADFAGPTSGTLAWDAGDGAPKSLEIEALSDAVDEGTEAFTVTLSDPTGGATLGSPAQAALFVADAVDGPCLSDEARLCLDTGRFVVAVRFAAAGAALGDARSVELTTDSGYFTFFDESNIEVVVKVLDACGFNDRFWVFAAGLTNVETRVTVTDTTEGEARVYANPQGVAFLPIQDTSAFATCP